MINDNREGITLLCRGNDSVDLSDNPIDNGRETILLTVECGCCRL